MPAALAASARRCRCQAASARPAAHRAVRRAAEDAKAAAETVNRFRTRGVKKGSEKWQKRQDASLAVLDELAKLDSGLADAVRAKLK